MSGPVHRLDADLVAAEIAETGAAIVQPGIDRPDDRPGLEERLAGAVLKPPPGEIGPRDVASRPITGPDLALDRDVQEQVATDLLNRRAPRRRASRGETASLREAYERALDTVVALKAALLAQPDDVPVFPVARPGMTYADPDGVVWQWRGRDEGWHPLPGVDSLTAAQRAAVEEHHGPLPGPQAPGDGAGQTGGTP